MRTASPSVGLAADGTLAHDDAGAGLGVADDVGLGAEELDDDHAGPDGAVGAEVQRLGSQAEHDVGPGARARRRPPRAGSGTEAPGKATHSVPRPTPPSPSGAPLSTSIPSTRFMPGLPRKCATNALAGRA